jgi:hypothetical protein
VLTLAGILAHVRAASGLDRLDGVVGIVVNGLPERRESGPVVGR